MRARGGRASKSEGGVGPGARQERERERERSEQDQDQEQERGAHRSRSRSQAEPPAVHLGAVYCCSLHMALASLGAWSAACSRECFSASHTGDFVWRDSVTEVAVGWHCDHQ